ncbi:hypothetical protein AB0O01_08780 [Streptomyces sp. NPDC093252]|uniref:hypothetical protein n=1 Tax=Streptomyces sp. NPDC093252 TaxID=3154980 RepID=UPI0034476E55
MTSQDRSAAPRDDPEHSISMVEQGPFCVARCSCGWRSPARRARSLARTDAAAHRVGG